jgi:hypothetical protein
LTLEERTASVFPMLARSAGLLSTLLASALASGCAQNAIFELYVEVPQAGAMVSQGARRGPVNFARARAFAGTPIDGDWVNIAPVGTRALSTEAGTHWLPVSLVGSANLDAPVNVRVELCETFGCEAPVAVWEIRAAARTLRLGRRTCRVQPLPSTDLPTMPTELATCDIAGCVNTELPSYCDGAAHYCDVGDGVVCDLIFDRVSARLLD